MEIALKIAGNQFNPIELNFIRFLIGGLALLPFTILYLRKNNVKISKGDWGRIALTGFVIVVLSMTLYQISIGMAKASVIAIMLSANPIFGLIIGFVFLKEKLSRTNVLALILTLVGLLIIINPFHLTGAMGIILGLISSVIFGLYGVMSRVNGNKIGLNGLSMTCLAFLFGSTELGVLMGISHIPAVSRMIPSNYAEFANIPFFKGITLQNLPLLLYISILVTGVAFGLYFVSMEKVGILQASLIFLVKPALAPVLALLILGEAMTANTIIGIVVILLGSLITLMGENIAYSVMAIFRRNNPEAHQEVDELEVVKDKIENSELAKHRKATEAAVRNKLESEREGQELPSED
ncbi:DMT family permease [Companilactobacillus mindensis DSM 14500]|uniref:DMT family permease n=2 Tax=Companilactobacillus mindensis TaxID=167481 RepID=A0A0R1QUP3_9LACO|nr:DMT family permease [Companilactobacillus mindensis DSM 14500]GEO79303.1 membrane protein [Companilactobacillus mindensis]